MMIQNLGLMAEAMGLGGFPHWAAHAYGWFQALGCRMASMPASQYMGVNPVLGKIAGWLGRDPEVPYVHGFEGTPGRDESGRAQASTCDPPDSPSGTGCLPLLTPFCPPYFASMEAAVRAVVELKFGEHGTFREGTKCSAWQNPAAVAQSVSRPSEATVEATIACCEYVYNRYGRFPAYSPPLRTVLGFQVNHLDLDFYDKFYQPQAVSENARHHFACWHGG